MEDAASPGQSRTNLNEAALLARMQAGDDGAFEACVRTYCSRLLLVARRILRNEEDANDAVQDQETRELVHHSINQLPETYRTVLLLRDIEGLATEEAARLLGTSTAVVKPRLHRARQGLRTLLDPHFRKGNL